KDVLQIVLTVRGLKDQAGAGEAGLGFLEFGDVERSEVESCRLDTGAGAGEGCGENNGVCKSQGVCGVGFGGVNVDPFEPGERFCIEPSTVGEQSCESGSRARRLLPAYVRNC